MREDFLGGARSAMSALGQKRTFSIVRRIKLYPQKRTLIERVGMSALCQKQTFTPSYSITWSAMGE
jgi:hypothetical protein